MKKLLLNIISALGRIFNSLFRPNANAENVGSKFKDKFDEYMTMNKLRIVMTIIIAFCICIYHFLSWTGDVMITTFGGQNLFVIYKFVNYALIVLFFFWALRWRVLTERLVGDAYIAGHYVGTSTEPDNKDREDHIEEFTISQNLLETTICGRSMIGEKTITNWTGILVRKDKFSDYVFYVAMQNDKIHEQGLLTIKINKDKSVNGFYESCNTEMRFVSILTAKKIS